MSTESRIYPGGKKVKKKKKSFERETKKKCRYKNPIPKDLKKIIIKNKNFFKEIFLLNGK
jgi:hypothetical protein